VIGGVRVARCEKFLQEEEKMRRLPSTIIFLAISVIPAAAETFDYDGSALVDCVCPVPAGQEGCDIKSYSTEAYSYSIGVKKDLSIDLIEVCIHRNPDICCVAVRDLYKATLAKKCVGLKQCK
jgi:hypothetical protein